MDSPAPWDPIDPLGEVLHRLRMRGVFYCRAELAQPWALRMPAVADSVSFHVVTAGSCWLDVEGAEPVELRTGDVALVPHGRGHVLAHEPGVAPAPAVETLPQRYLSEHYSLLRHGGSGRPARLICGIVSFDEPPARALLGSLPPVVHVDATSGAGPTSIHDTVRLIASELSALRPGGESVATRLADILVIQAVRAWLDRDPGARTGWLGALRDPQIGRALAAIHADPGRDWTLELLAGEAAMSRSTFSARFTELVGRPAMAYLTAWRMQLAYVRLREREPVGEVARSLGYRTEASFTRAFARVVGTTPGAVRAGGPTADPVGLDIRNRSIQIDSSSDE